jgi:hypothetical protein
LLDQSNMDSQQQQHLQELYQAYLKRLRVLELKEAQLGLLDTPPYILTEIDSLRNKIADIESQLATLRHQHQNDTIIKPSDQQTTLAQNTLRIEIVFKGDFTSLTPELQGATIRAIAALIDISPDQVVVHRVSGGSIIFEIEIPVEAAKKLVTLYEDNDPVIDEIGIAKIVVISNGDDELRERLSRDPVNKENKFIVGIRISVYFLILLGSTVPLFFPETRPFGIIVLVIVLLIFVIVAFVTNSDRIKIPRSQGRQIIVYVVGFVIVILLVSLIGLLLVLWK